LEGGINLWPYAAGNPINFVDPFGLKQLSFEEAKKLVEQNNKSGLSNELILCIMWAESSHDPDAPHTSKTETGLMAMTKDAATDVGYTLSDLRDNAKNVAAGSTYLKLTIKRKGSLGAGMRSYGTGETYPVDKILECEKCLKNNPCNDNPQKCLDKIHK
jgi:soluble lytic murein transglycosylase-like protein